MKHDPLYDDALRDLDERFDADRDVRGAAPPAAARGRVEPDVEPQVLLEVDDDPALPADLQLLRRAAYTLDAAVEIPVLKVRIGLDPLLGLVPGIGDAVAFVMGASLVASAWRHRVPKHVLARMIGNLVVDSAIGAVPVVGDVLDVFSKSNLKNLDLLLRHRNKALPPRALPAPGQSLSRT